MSRPSPAIHDSHASQQSPVAPARGTAAAQNHPSHHSHPSQPGLDLGDIRPAASRAIIDREARALRRDPIAWTFDVQAADVTDAERRAVLTDLCGGDVE